MWSWPIVFLLLSHKKIKAERIRVALGVQNLFTVSHMKSKYIDPEIGSMNTFQPYRIFNIGLSANF